MTEEKKKRRPSVALGLWLIKRIERILIRYSLVPGTPFLDPSAFSWVRTLEADWELIRAELDRLLEAPERIPNFQDISRDQYNISRDDKWKSYFLYGYGYKMENNCKACPETTRILESIPDMFTAFFSVLAPGKHIPLHRGPYRGLLRCHLALVVPEPREDCWIEVGGETSTWEEGRCIVFDDTYRHRVENNTGGRRVVMFIDIRRPLKFPGSLLNRVVLFLIRLSPYIQDARRNQVAWEKRLGEPETENYT
ncbi:MAG: aspartyl/asparaginyl beta-hydroxylase domain-containing protein [Gammaproteobacteria bacterium]|nr:aspartyl/asparaginyl beta-hydroxylase domain-containing protein [Gammaproteobacteria bacterium]